MFFQTLNPHSYGHISPFKTPSTQGVIQSGLLIPIQSCSTRFVPVSRSTTAASKVLALCFASSSAQRPVHLQGMKEMSLHN